VAEDTIVERPCWLSANFVLKGLAFSPDEQQCLMINSRGESMFKSIATGHETNRNLNFTAVTGAAFSGDGRRFAAVNGNGVCKIWETATLREVATVRGFLLGAHSAAFSTDGRRLVVGGAGKEAVKLWDVESQQELLTLEGLEGEVSRFGFAPSFSPDGNVLGALSTRGVLHLWRAPSWAEIDAAEKAKAEK